MRRLLQLVALVVILVWTGRRGRGPQLLPQDPTPIVYPPGADPARFRLPVLTGWDAEAESDLYVPMPKRRRRMVTVEVHRGG